MTDSLRIGEARRRKRRMGIVFFLCCLAILILFTPGTGADDVTTFTFVTARGMEIPIADLIFPTLVGLYLMAGLAALAGIWQFAKGFEHPNMVLGVVAAFFVLAFLTWAARGRSMNMTGMLSSSLLRAVPIALAALSGIMCERSGVVNIGIEGMMLMGAFCAALFGSLAGSVWIGLLAAMLGGGLMAVLLAVLAIRYKVDQIVAGTAINILATGLTSYLSTRYLQVNPELNRPPTFSPVAIPGVASIPIIGPVLFTHTLPVYLTFILVAGIFIMLFYTRWGLRSRAVGEHPRAADTLGVNVFKVRYVNVILGGLVAGLGGAYLVLASVARFDQLMTAGKGFIGLAAMIFGKWNPIGALGASLIFGFADALQTRLAILAVPIPSQFLLMAPYLVTIIVLAGVVGQSRAPAADGRPYEKE